MNGRNTTSLLLLLLSRFSRVRLCATPQTAAHQAPPSLGFSRQEHWSGLPFPSPVHESEKSEVAQSCPTLSDPMDCSPPGSSIHGIFPGKSTGVGCHCVTDECKPALLSQAPRSPAPYRKPWAAAPRFFSELPLNLLSGPDVL